MSAKSTKYALRRYTHVTATPFKICSNTLYICVDDNKKRRIVQCKSIVQSDVWGQVSIYWGNENSTLRSSRIYFKASGLQNFISINFCRIKTAPCGESSKCNWRPGGGTSYVFCLLHVSDESRRRQEGSATHLSDASRSLEFCRCAVLFNFF